MKQRGASFIDSIGLVILGKGLLLGTLLGTVSGAGLLYHLGEKYESEALTLTAGVVFLIGLF